MRSIVSCMLCVCIYSIIIIPATAQTINWTNPERGHVMNAAIGADYGITYGLGYGYKTGSKFPLIARVGFSVPSGNRPFDDFAAQYGVEMSVFHWRNIHGTVSIDGIYRRFQNDLVTAKNFGAEMSVSLGVYKTSWFAAAEAGFDKAIVTHFQHSTAYKAEFPLVRNGWYNPPTGGNFNYGVRAGLSFKRSELTLRLGKIVAEDFKSKPMLPFYAKLGYNYRIPHRVKH